MGAEKVDHIIVDGGETGALNHLLKLLIEFRVKHDGDFLVFLELFQTKSLSNFFVILCRSLGDYSRQESGYHLDKNWIFITNGSEI